MERSRAAIISTTTEVWQEALRIPPVKVYEKGKLRKDVWDLIFANIRLDIVADDMRAEIGSCVVGERGLLKLIERYGYDSFERHKEYLYRFHRKNDASGNSDHSYGRLLRRIKLLL